MNSGERTGRSTATATAAVEAVLVYVAFLSWDRTVVVDPVTGSTSGPYDTWQVLGCALVLGLVAATGGRAQRPRSTAAATTVGFTVAWSLGAATSGGEDANLWPIGAFVTALGTFAWTLVVALVAERLTRTRPGEDA